MSLKKGFSQKIQFPSAVSLLLILIVLFLFLCIRAIRLDSMYFYNPNLNKSVRLGMNKDEITAILGSEQDVISNSEFCKRENPEITGSRLPEARESPQGKQISVSSYLSGKDMLYVTYCEDKVVGLGTWHRSFGLASNAFSWQLAGGPRYGYSLAEWKERFPESGVFSVDGEDDPSKPQMAITQAEENGSVITCSFANDELVSIYLCLPQYISDYTGYAAR